MASRDRSSVSAASRSGSSTHSPAPHRRHSRSRSRSHRRSRHSDSRSPRTSRRNGYESSRVSSRTKRSRSPMSNRRRHVGTRDDPEPSMCLGVFGLNVDTKPEKLTEIFEEFGKLRKVQIVLDAKAWHGFKKTSVMKKTRAHHFPFDARVAFTLMKRSNIARNQMVVERVKNKM